MEQSKVQLYKNIINLLRRCRRESILEWFKAYYLTGMSRKECLLSIIQIWWHLVVIDRIADLIKCANDEAEEHNRRGRTMASAIFSRMVEQRDAVNFHLSLYCRRDIK